MSPATVVGCRDSAEGCWAFLNESRHISLGRSHTRPRQTGDKHPDAKPLKGFGGAVVLEAVDDFAGDTYRTVYTVRFPNGVYVLHAFQKKAKRGIATPKRDLEIIRSRLRRAQEHAAGQKGPRT